VINQCWIIGNCSNGEIQGKMPENAMLTCLGAGAAGIATLDLLCELGFQKSNILLVDSKGVINNQREN
jgi:malic enzyme